MYFFQNSTPQMSLYLPWSALALFFKYTLIFLQKCDHAMPVVLKLVQEQVIGNSLVAQWLRFPGFTAEGFSSIPGWGTKILEAAGCGNKQTKNNHVIYHGSLPC